MITVRGRKVSFSGKDAVKFQKIADDLGMSAEDALTGMLWEKIMQEARAGIFKRAKERKSGK
jgi:hypothetical protein